MAAAFIGCEDHQTAKQILLPVLQHTQEEGIRQRVLINLLEIAAKDSEQTRRLIGTATSIRRYVGITGHAEAYYHLYVGEGPLHLFGNTAAAIEEMAAGARDQATGTWVDADMCAHSVRYCGLRSPLEGGVQCVWLVSQS